MTEKDYSLLRPFEPVAVKAGAKLVVGSLQGLLDYVAGPDKSGWIVCNNENDVFVFVSKDHAKVPPLCWVGGKPVYPGDVLEHAKLGELVAKSRHASREMLVTEKFDSVALGNLAWPRPKPVKRWINIYNNIGYDTKAAADQAEVIGRIACIEIELPPLKL